MKILFVNKILTASITSDDFSENYPPANLAHIFLRKRYQNKSGADRIVFDFLEDVMINCFFYGYNNGRDLFRLCEDGSLRITEDGIIRGIVASAMTLNLYDYLGNLLHTEEIVQAEQFGDVFFDDVLLVRTAEVIIDWAGGGAAYLGGCGMGEIYTMPDPVNNWTDDLEDNSIVSESLGGQSIQNYIDPLDVHHFIFNEIERATFAEIKALIKAIGKGRPMWVDLFEGAHDQIAPCYAKLVDGMESQAKTGATYGFELTFKECC